MPATPNINAEKIQGNLSLTTLSATTYYNLPTDIRVTGGTYSNGTTIFTNNTGGTFNVTGFYTGATDVFVTGGTYSNGTATFRNNTGGTFNVTGFYAATTDVFVTGGTYSSGVTTFTNNTGGTFNVTGYFTGNTMTGQTSVDFGFTGGGESDYAYTVISNTNILQSSMVMYSVISSNHHQETEDSLLDGLIFKTSDIVDGVSFNVNCYSLNNTWGSYNVFYKIIN